MSLKDLGDRRSGDLTPEVLQRTLDSAVAPRRIFTRHSDRELANLLPYARPSHAPSPRGPFARNQMPVPPQDRVGRHKRRHFAQDPSPKAVAFRCQSAPLSVGQPQALSTQVFFENAVLCPQVVDDVELVAIHPARERNEENL